METHPVHHVTSCAPVEAISSRKFLSFTKCKRLNGEHALTLLSTIAKGYVMLNDYYVQFNYGTS